MSRRLKVSIALGIVLGVAIVVPVIRHYQLRAATETYLAQLKAQGEPMELAQVIPPTVSLEQNGADTFRRAAALIDADTHLDYTNYVYGMVMIAPGKAMVRWQQPDVRDSDVTNSWEAVDAAVSQNAQSFALLQQMIAKPNFDFHINYDGALPTLISPISICPNRNERRNVWRPLLFVTCIVAKLLPQWKTCGRCWRW
jgi:hypothetical protein